MQLDTVFISVLIAQSLEYYWTIRTRTSKYITERHGKWAFNEMFPVSQLFSWVWWGKGGMNVALLSPTEKKLLLHYIGLVLD